MTTFHERHRHDRYEISTDVDVQFVIPDQTFSPKHFPGIALDISFSGMRVKSYDVDKATYLDLLKKMPYARIACNFQSLKEPLLLRGQIVWARFYEGSSKDRPHCLLGLYFNKFSDQAEKEFADVMKSIRESSQETKPISGVPLPKKDSST